MNDATNPTSCPHCQTPVEAGAPTAPYCCQGCRAAHALLTERGLERFYTLGCGIANPTGGDEAGAPLAWLEPLVERARLAGREGRVSVTMDVQGIHCAACVWLIQTLFSRAAGSVRADVNPGVGRVTLTFEDGVFDLAAFVTDLAQVGYRMGPPLKAAHAASDGLGVKLGVSVALTMNVMMLSFAGYFGLDPTEEPGIAALFGWASAALTTVAVLVGGPVFFRAAWGALRRRALHLDVPIALGILLSWGGSLWLFATEGADAAYFDTTTTFITLMLVGRFLQQRYVERSRRILLADSGLEGLRVRTVGLAGEIALTPVTEVLCGTRLLVAPGELVPVDATLEEDGADFGLAWISGESDPVAFAPGGLVPAGAHLLGGAARRLVAAQGFGESAVHDLLAPKSGADVTESDPFWHRLATAYVVGVLVAAAVALIAWWGAGPERAVQVAIAVLVVTCPCAIGLATPLAYELAHARLRAGGFFVRRLDLLDRLRRVRQVFFDKTGTVTLGALELKGGAAAFDGLDAAAVAALGDMVARSNHPKSRAILRALEASGAVPHLREGVIVEERAGQGLHLADGGATWRLVADPDAPADAAERAL
ncbi:MAG: heavy metal translocating P-type ATPase, partial [Myxococcales bacterium]|nr:heavy metal translocating P-type ATPase [Myxococcales bacterium]